MEIKSAAYMTICEHFYLRPDTEVRKKSNFRSEFKDESHEGLERKKGQVFCDLLAVYRRFILQVRREFQRGRHGQVAELQFLLQVFGRANLGGGIAVFRTARPEGLSVGREPFKLAPVEPQPVAALTALDERVLWQIRVAE